MRILLTNDDGIDADGLSTLVRACEGLGELHVVAPAVPQSGVGHAVTTGAALRVEERGGERFAIHGTPADCTRAGLTTLVREVDWVIAGINHGANLGSDTYISGTVAAAREAALLGVPAVAISQYVGPHRGLDWTRSLERARPVLRALLDRGAPPGGFWNVNLPHPPDEATACDVVECAVDPSPHAVRFARRDGALHWQGRFHERPREAGKDVDVCFGGRISVSAIRVRPHP